MVQLLPDESDHESVLRGHGLHVTAQRLAVLRAVADAPHRTADDIDKVVRSEIGAVSRSLAATFSPWDSPLSTLAAWRRH